MSKISNVFQKPKTRMRSIIVVLVILVAAAVLFILYENQTIRSSYLSVYLDRQDNYTNQLSYELESLIQDDKTEAQIIDYFGNHAEVSGNSWMYVAKENTVLFAKDKSTTESLLKDREKDVLVKQLEEQNALLSSKELQIDNVTYTVGAVTDIDYALTKGNIVQQQIYNTLFVTIILMLSIMALIGVVAKLNRRENELFDTKETLRTQNMKLERTGELAATAEEFQAQPELEEREFYDEELIRLFLSKSNDESLHPMQILFSSIVMTDRYYSKKEIFTIMNSIKSVIGRKHVMGEIKKGSFVVLMYQTNHEEAEKILELAKEKLASLNVDSSIQMKMNVLEVEQNMSALDVFERGIRG